MGVVLLRPSAMSSSGGATAGGPASSAGAAFLKISPEVLRKAVSDVGLAEAWQLSEAEAAARLQAFVICDSIPGTRTVEVKVRKLPAADALMACEAITRHTNEEMAAEQLARESEELGRWKAEAEMTQTELESMRSELREWIGGHPISSKEPELLKKEFEVKQRRLEQIKLKILSDEMMLRIMPSPAPTVVAPHWPGKPSPRHLKRFGIAAAWAFGVSVLIAIAMAYLLEAMIPRKQAQEAMVS